MAGKEKFVTYWSNFFCRSLIHVSIRTTEIMKFFLLSTQRIFCSKIAASQQTSQQLQHQVDLGPNQPKSTYECHTVLFH